MIITVPVITEPGRRDADLPEGASLDRIIEDHGDTMTVRIQTDMTDRELVQAIPSYVPDRVDPGHLMVALLNFDEEVFDAIEHAIGTDKAVRAAMRGSFVSRHSLMLQGFCQHLGITEEQKNQLFRAAAVLHL